MEASPVSLAPLLAHHKFLHFGLPSNIMKFGRSRGIIMSPYQLVLLGMMTHRAFSSLRNNLLTWHGRHACRFGRMRQASQPFAMWRHRPLRAKPNVLSCNLVIDGWSIWPPWASATTLQWEDAQALSWWKRPDAIRYMMHLMTWRPARKLTGDQKPEINNLIARGQ
jgi:hypothetical protein